MLKPTPQPYLTPCVRVQVCDFLYEDNTTLVWDNEQQVPFAYNGDQWVGFDDERSLGIKVSHTLRRWCCRTVLVQCSYCRLTKPNGRLDLFLYLFS